MRFHRGGAWLAEDPNLLPPGQTALHNLMSGIMSTSAQLYINGLKAVHRTLSPVLCAKVFSAMKEIRQLLITADSFNEQVHQVKKLWQ